MLVSKYILSPILLLTTALSLPALEPLIDSTKIIREPQAKNTLKKSDKNKDGKIDKSEDPKLWRTHARYDKNKDKALDLNELTNSPDVHLDSPGKKVLNVLYKQTPQGGVFFDFYFPDNNNSTEKPVVLFTHGGGWAAGSKAKAGIGSFSAVHKALLKKGFCVLSVGYRKVRKDGSTAMRDCVIDSLDALRYISAYKNELGIDPNKIYTFGDSAGGHLAQMALLASPESFKGDTELYKYSYKTVAGVSWYGPCDFQEIQLFNHDDRENFNDRFGSRIMYADTKPSEKEELYREMSPIHYLKSNSPPLLMIQGDKDTTIPVKHAYKMQEVLKSIQAPVEILIVKNSGHNWRSVNQPIEPTREVIVEKTIQFFLKHL